MADSKRVKIPIKTYLVYLILVTFLVTGVTFSRFITTVTGGDSATVAKPIIEFTLTDEAILEGEKSVFNLDPISMKPGDEINYTVSISNWDVDDNFSQVALQYTLSASVACATNNDPPIQALIYIDETQIADETHPAAGTFYLNTLQEPHLYILKLVWDSGDNIYEDYAGDVYTVTVTVDWQQKVSG